jgi:creatinine amidohydrolase
MGKFEFRSLTWEEVNEAVRREPVVLLPVGAIEQHGPHLPLDVDNLGAETVCLRAAEKVPELLLVMPAVHYGFNEQGLDFPGTISITEQHFVGYCYDICGSLERMGFRKILLVNGHGGNSALLEVVARLVTARTEALAAAVDYYFLAKDAANEVRESSFPGGMTHAGEFETSVYMALAPHLVKTERIQKELLGGGEKRRWFWKDLLDGPPVKTMNVVSRLTQTGVAGDPTVASPEKGALLLAAAVENLVDVAREFKSLPIGSRRSHLVKPGSSGGR